MNTTFPWQTTEERKEFMKDIRAKAAERCDRISQLIKARETLLSKATDETQKEIINFGTDMLINQI